MLKHISLEEAATLAKESSKYRVPPYIWKVLIIDSSVSLDQFNWIISLQGKLLKIDYCDPLLLMFPISHIQTRLD